MGGWSGHPEVSVQDLAAAHCGQKPSKGKGRLAELGALTRGVSRAGGVDAGVSRAGGVDAGG